MRSADDLKEVLGQVVCSQQRLCGDFRGFGFKVIPRVSHLWKLGHQGRAEHWRRDRKRRAVESAAGAPHGAQSGGISKSERE